MDFQNLQSHPSLLELENQLKIHCFNLINNEKTSRTKSILNLKTQIDKIQKSVQRTPPQNSKKIQSPANLSLELPCPLAFLAILLLPLLQLFNSQRLKKLAQELQKSTCQFQPKLLNKKKTVKHIIQTRKAVKLRVVKSPNFVESRKKEATRSAEDKKKVAEKNLPQNQKTCQ